jgi:hypothetical protein
VETITHSLLGAALAELALPAGATKVQRRIFFAAGIVAANFPDAHPTQTLALMNRLGWRTSDGTCGGL